LRVDEFKKEVRRACLTLNLPEARVIQERLGSVKLRIELSQYRFIDVYFNERTGTLNSALLEKGRRILGINGYRKRVWHMHPFGRAREHITVRPMRIEEVLRQYALFLKKKSLA
jgi:hypothetical protein